MKIGIAGAGRMGGAMALRLLEVGHEVFIWNRSQERLAPLVDAGARVADTPAALAGAVEVIISSLLDAAALAQVYEGPDGLLSVSLSGKLIIEMSTVQPDDEVALAGKVRAQGGAFLECPVGGTIGPARTGKLLGLAGGEAADFDRARPLLDQLCRRVEHVGPVGAGASMKLAINLPLLVFYQAFGEAFTLCRHLGLSTEWLVDFFSDTSGGANVLKGRRDPIAKALAGEDIGPASFAVDAIRKDLRTMIAEAAKLNRELPVTARTLEVYDAASRAGLGDKDGAALTAFWSSQSRG